MRRVEMVPLGDAALLFVWPDEERAGPPEIAALADQACKPERPGVREWVPAYRSVAVHLDLAALAPAGSGKSLARKVGELAESLLDAFRNSETEAASGKARHIRLPIAWGGSNGPDLQDCASRCGMTEESFVRAFAETVFEVAMMGFAPGFPYMSGLPERLAQPRHASPRLKVPAGSVGIAGRQAGIYPVESPGGWQLIGRTTVRLFRPEAETPFLLAPGDRVSFVPAGGTEEGTEEGVRPDPDEAGAAGNASGGNKGGLSVTAPGMQTTVQDRGRFGWQAYGVSAGGAMDARSMRMANALVGNPDDAAVLEMTLLGPSFRADRDLLIAVCGADFDARAGGEPLPMNRPVWVRAGTELTFDRARRGCRAYLAVAGGIDVPPVLGSRSTDPRAGIGGMNGRALAAGDVLPVGPLSRLGLQWAETLRKQADAAGRAWASARWEAGPPSVMNFAGAGRKGDKAESRRFTLRIVRGAEWETFGEEAQNRLLQSEYRVQAASDRMGIRLSGHPLGRERTEELISHGVVPGTLQVPPDGQPIVLAAGCQPTGGYPKIAHVIGADLPILGQFVPGDRAAFELVSHEEAWEAWLAEERELRMLQAGIRLRGVEV